VKDQGWYEDARQYGNAPDEIQLFHMGISDHGEEDAQIPDRANEQERRK